MALHAKFNGFCTECRLPIHKGARIRWSKKKGTRHQKCYVVRVLPKNLELMRNAAAARFFEEVSAKVSEEFIKNQEQIVRVQIEALFGVDPAYLKGEDKKPNVK